MLRYFNAEKIDATLSRKDGGSYVNGIWSPAATADTSVRLIAPQPIRSEDKEMLPDGEFAKNYRVTWIENALQMWGGDPTDSGNPNPDILTILGREYHVWQIDERNVLGNYYRAIIRERKDNE